ncbi:MAG: hypothetical protein AB1806_00375 [Acidobacteriota bacterium]
MVGPVAHPPHATGRLADVLQRVNQVWLNGPPTPELVPAPPVSRRERPALRTIGRWQLFMGRPATGRDIGPAFRHVRALRDRDLVERRRLALVRPLSDLYRQRVDEIVRQATIDLLADQETF